jgi:hypothetical protein
MALAVSSKLLEPKRESCCLLFIMTSSLSREQDPAGDITPNFDVFLLGKKDVAKAAKVTRNPYFTLTLANASGSAK